MSRLRYWGRRTLQGAESRNAHSGGEWVVRTPSGIAMVDSWAEVWGKGTIYETVVGGVLVYAREVGVCRTRVGAAIIAHRWIKSLCADADTAEGEET